MGGCILKTVRRSCRVASLLASVCFKSPTQTSLGNAGQLLTSLKQEYDQLGRVVSIANPANQTWQASYDSNGNATQAKAPNGTTLNQTYDALSRVVQTSQTGSNGNGGTTTQTIINSYNAQDLIKQITDPKTLNTAYGLDGFGQTKQQDSPDTKQTVATYDNNGNILTKTDAKGQKTTYTYDALNRLTQTLYHDGSKVIYTYDTDTVTNLGKVGRLTNISERNPANQQTAAWHAIYDGFGRIVQTDTIQGGVTLVQKYTYNTKGQLTSQSYPSGRLINYQYDLTGQLTGISTTVTTNTGTTTTQVASNITYHANGQIKSYTVNGTTNKVFTRTLDTNGRLSSYTSSHLNDGTPVATPLTYDANGRLTQLAAQTYEYDALDRLTKATIGDEVQTYTYDNTGNRLTNQKTKAGSVLALMSYSYDAVSHRLSNINTTIAAKTTAQAQGFDANGNTTSDGNSGGTNYTYDVRNRLIKATNASATANYTINDQGQRTRKLLTQAGTTTDTSFVYDLAGQLIAEYPTTTPASPRQEIVWLGNLPITVFDRNASNVVTTNTIYPDHLGTPRLIVNPANTTVWKWQNLDAFGNNLATNETIKFNLRFPGQYFDTETGLHYNWNRDYNPKLGRYIQSDPIGLEGGISTYNYVGNDPLNAVDYDGLKKVILFDDKGDEKYFSDLAKKFKDDPSLCLVYGHGTPEFIVNGSGKEGGGKKLNEKELALVLEKAGCNKNMPVKIYACRTGQNDNSIAEKFRKLWNAPVSAPTRQIWYSTKDNFETTGPSKIYGKTPDIKMDIKDPGYMRDFK